MNYFVKKVTGPILFVTLFGNLVACSKQSSTQSLVNVMAANNIEGSLNPILVKETPTSTSSTEDLHLDHERVQLKISALEKEFLLQISFIEQPSVAMGSALKSRVVAFRRRGDKVYMLEATQGHSISKDLPQNLVLAEMPILSDDGTNLVIDFNKGMANIMIAGEWRASDLDGRDYNSKTEFSSIPLQFSYIEEANIEKNHLVIRQVAQAIVGKNEVMPVEIKYYLSPYRPTVGFERSQTNGDFDRMGFFETAPIQRINQDNITYAIKFNKSSPIEYAISSNTPEEYKQAVRDGILYWNQAFGDETIKVVDAPAGVTAPNLNYNIVQWIKYDTAGFAYADAQSDPRTGETLHAQIFLTSVFALGGKQDARKAILEWDKEKNIDESKGKQLMSLRGFHSGEHCQYSITKNFINSLKNLVSTNADDKKILKASQDYVREVTAHEVGHTLGLRHNFAGSLAANYEMSDRSKINQTYYETGSTPDKLITSSSVMEYQVFEEATWTGDQIAKKKGILPYDEKAIQALYFGKTFEDSEIPLFCTDSHVELFNDCERFDLGRTYVEIIKTDDDLVAKSLAQKIMNRFIGAIAPAAGNPPKSLKKVVLPNPKLTAVEFNSKAIGSLEMLEPTFKLLSIYRAYPYVSSNNESSVKESQLNYLQSELKSHGGWEQFLKDDGSILMKKAQDQFKKILQEQKQGIGFNEQEYEFNQEEIQYILNRVSSYFQEVSKEIATINTNLLDGSLVAIKYGKLPDHEASNDLALVLLEKARQIIFSETGEKSFYEISVVDDSAPTITKSEDGKKKEKETPKMKKIMVSIPTYKYSYKNRLTAANFLNGSRSESISWGLMERKTLLKELKESTKDALTVELSTLEASDMPNIKLAQWILENKKIKSALDN
jgi:hypothetical protein